MQRVRSRADDFGDRVSFGTRSFGTRKHEDTEAHEERALRTNPSRSSRFVTFALLRAFVFQTLRAATALRKRMQDGKLPAFVTTP
jgi:hypothetical protein